MWLCADGKVSATSWMAEGATGRKLYVLEEALEMATADVCGTMSLLLEKSRRSLHKSVEQDGRISVPHTTLQFYKYNSILLFAVARAEKISVLGLELVVL